MSGERSRPSDRASREAGLSAAAWSALTSPDVLGGEVLSRRPDRWVVAFEELGVVVKVYRRRAGLRGVLDLLFGDRARRTSALSHAARARGISVPQVLGFASGPLGSAVVLERIVGGRPFRSARESAGSLTARRRLDVALARFLRALHDARLYHGDFHQGNVLVDARGALVLVDLDGLRRVAFLSTRRRVRNLERLFRDFLGEHRVSRAARMRFLVRYARSRAGAHALWRAVSKRSEMKRAEYRLPPP